MENNLLSTREAAAIIGVTPGRINQFVTAGRLKPDATLRGAHLFFKSQIYKFKRIPRSTGSRKKTAKSP